MPFLHSSNEEGIGGRREVFSNLINDLNAFACCRRANVKTMMRLGGSALGMALVVFGPSCARADTITYLATGQLQLQACAATPAIGGTVSRRTPL